MNNFDKLLFKTYDYEQYNCAHFLVECWKELFDLDFSFMLPSAKHLGLGEEHKINNIKDFKRFKLIKKPISPCVILCKSVATNESHFATFYKNKVLQITYSGVSFLPREVAFLMLKDIKYYEYRLYHKQC